ncbi:glycoside hydrolase [Epibacterium sp. SM1969]|uniref:Glycoside hydrolase n=1 Tax=Tritonibacter aquimaris TaxID=2663379 RepID=A0A844AKS4_9RHOB|nr:GH25 family lysozyme [Tritonibacter aquimaris]MQY42410.1 glycoside hydrolase [Tritonibacter aquimaris]
MRIKALLVALVLAGCSAPEPADMRAFASQIVFAGLKFGDSDPVAWRGRTPASYPVHGIDASRWQGDIDWRKARRAGVSFAFLKATEGGDLVDPQFSTHWHQSRKARVKRSAYHYYYFCRSAKEQARWFIRNVPRDSAALPHVLDMEWNPTSRTCTKRPSGKKVRAEARRFLSILERHYGKRPIIYTTVDFYRDTGIGQLQGTEFWLRSVAGHPRDVYPGQSWTFWQYTGTGRVPGIQGDVDINVFRGSREAWQRWQGD